MCSKAKRILEQLSEEEKKIITEKIGEADGLKTSEEASYINKLLEEVEVYHIDTCAAMRQCGACCLEKDVVEEAKKLYQKASNTEDFLTLLNEAGIGGNHLRLEGNKILATYEECYCDTPKKVDAMHAKYCECSAGWYQSLFSEVLKKRVNVKIIDTILNGAPVCTFEITAGK